MIKLVFTQRVLYYKGYFLSQVFCSTDDRIKHTFNQDSFTTNMYVFIYLTAVFHIVYIGQPVY